MEETVGEEEFQLLIEKRQAYRDLLRSEGWKQLDALMEEQVRQREAQDKALDLVTNEHALMQLVELRAERRMVQLVRSLPEAIIASITEELSDEPDDGNE